METTEKSSHPNKQKRQEVVQNIINFEAYLEHTNSERQAAKATGVPRSTCQYRKKKKENDELSPSVVAFFHSIEGLAFLHRLTIAIQFAVTQLGGCGIRVVQTVLELSQLSHFVASSIGSLHQTAEAMEKCLINYSQEETDRLSKVMQPKEITVCSDETFPSGKTCLVGMEPVSNFILLEQFTENRRYETWSQAWDDALIDLPVTVIQSTGDDGQAIVKCAKDRLGVHHSPDVFHIQQDVSKATSAPLRARIKSCKKTYESASKQVDKHLATKSRDEQSPKPKRGRPIDHNSRIAQAKMQEELAEQALKAAEKRRDDVKKSNKALGESYHPVNLKTGEIITGEVLKKTLNGHFKTIKAEAEDAGLSDKCLKRIHKASKKVDAMVDTLTFFWLSVNAYLKQQLGLSDAVKEIIHDHLIPIYYITEAAKKASDADSRKKLTNMRLALVEKFNDEPIWQSLKYSEREQYQKHALHCARLFQRSSSCVEGRNGQLSLKHHSLSRMSNRKLKSLTVVHNYFIKRTDGTTAAERFFEDKPKDLFEYLVNHLDYPAIPAKRRKAA
jgi:hypothetical protein